MTLLFAWGLAQHAVIEETMAITKYTRSSSFSHLFDNDIISTIFLPISFPSFLILGNTCLIYIIVTEVLYLHILSSRSSGLLPIDVQIYAIWATPIITNIQSLILANLSKFYLYDMIVAFALLFWSCVPHFQLYTFILLIMSLLTSCYDSVSFHACNVPTFILVAVKTNSFFELDTLPELLFIYSI